MSRKSTIVLIQSLFLTFSLLSAGQVVGGPAKVTDERHAAFSALIQKIYTEDDDGSFNVSPDSSKVLTELDGLIGQTVNAVMSKSSARDTDLAAELSSLRGMRRSSGYSNTPSASIFSVNGVRTIAVSYLLIEGAGNWAVPGTHPHLDFYTYVMDRWVKTAQAPVEEVFHEFTFFVDRMNVKDQTKSWFLVYGNRVGDTGARMMVRLFSYDGTVVTKIWQKDELTGGDLELKDDEITLRYGRKYQSADPSNLAEFHFRIVGDEVQCVSPVCQ